MEREGVKEEISRVKEEKENRTYERLKCLLKAGKLKRKAKPRPGERDIRNMRIETQYAIFEQPNITQNRPESRAEGEDKTIMKNETDYAINEGTNVILHQPHMSDSECQLSFPGRGVDICEQTIQERTQDLPSSAVEEATLVLLGNSMD